MVWEYNNRKAFWNVLVMDMQNFNNEDDIRSDLGIRSDSGIRRGSGRCRGYVHVVEAGDTLYKLSRKYDVRLFDIMRLNPYVNVYNLQIGDEICIPTMSARPEKTYVVNEGDTISDILKAFDVDFETLAKWNPMLMEVELPEGLILKMPLVQPRNGMQDFQDDMVDCTDEKE